MIPTETLTLSAEEQSMLAGEAGPAAALAMRILSRLAPVYGARRLLPVTRAHVDGCIYAGEAGLDYAEQLASLGARVSVPTSLNAVSLDRQDWKRLGIPSSYAARARRVAEAYLAMGAKPTFTCAPYQTDVAPSFGEQIAWSESNAVAFANSVIGARTNRYGDYLDIACAITGRVPAAGLHLDEPRLGTLLLDLQPLPPQLVERDDFWPVLGYLLGSLAGDEVPVVRGLEAAPSDDQLQSLAAAAATSGSVAIFHLVGITPEAPNEADAFGGRQPRVVRTIDIDDLRHARAELRTSPDDAIDLVAFGSPHCSLAECRSIARLTAGKRAAPSVRVFVTTSRAVRELLARTGDLETLEAFGASVVADTCIVVSPPLVPSGAKVLMTNSAKYAHYGPGILGVEAIFGSTESCIESAVNGRLVEEDGPWRP
ncbi:MAG TPA: aconitase X catalytic domain-containing protein [Thermomicrobiales bacterium]|nr:aconitase X catalytic domain-containing protein [Thermomicrobiales bacterium]